MEVDTENTLGKILSKEELDKIPPDILQKLESHFVEKFEEFLTSKALCETAKRSIGTYYKQTFPVFLKPFPPTQIT